MTDAPVISDDLDRVVTGTGLNGYWIMRRCQYWDAARNRRFRLARIDSGPDHCGRYSGAIWDGDRRIWLDQWRMGGIAGHELARRARPKEIPSAAIGQMEFGNR